MSHALHWTLVDSALLKKSIAHVYHYIGYIEWLWSWKSVNFIDSRNTCKMKNFWESNSLRWWPMTVLTFCVYIQQQNLLAAVDWALIHKLTIFWWQLIAIGGSFLLSLRYPFIFIFTLLFRFSICKYKVPITQGQRLFNSRKMDKFWLCGW